jgi:hypothetical protein
MISTIARIHAIEGADHEMENDDEHATSPDCLGGGGVPAEPVASCGGGQRARKKEE